MSPVNWTNMNEIMDKAYKVCSYVRGYVPPICRVWAPLISGGYIKFRMKYGNEYGCCGRYGNKTVYKTDVRKD